MQKYRYIPYESDAATIEDVWSLRCGVEYRKFRICGPSFFCRILILVAVSPRVLESCRRDFGKDFNSDSYRTPMSISKWIYFVLFVSFLGLYRNPYRISLRGV